MAAVPRVIVCWTNDWETTFLGVRQPGQAYPTLEEEMEMLHDPALRIVPNEDVFVSVSLEIASLANELIDGKLTWFAKVDRQSDITTYIHLRPLYGQITASGGEIGLHIHHSSVDPNLRRRELAWAVERLSKVGIQARAYSAGMGNFLSSDTNTLTELGIVAHRSCMPYLYTGDPALDPASADWRYGDFFHGYTDPTDHHLTVANGQLFSVPLGADARNTTGYFELAINPRIDLGTLMELFDTYTQLAVNGPVYVAVMFHPCDLTEYGAAVTSAMRDRWARFSAYQRRQGATFMTMSEAAQHFRKSARLLSAEEIRDYHE
jgi:hypothetical protein